MAEAFGLAAGVLQVADFGAELGSTLWTCAKRIRHANKELEALAGQVDATAKCLGSVGNLLEDPETRAFHTSKLYKDTRAVSKGCDEIFFELDKAIRKFNNGGPKMSVLARLQWPLSSTKLAESFKILKNYSDVLHLMLAVLQIVEGRRAATSEELRALGASLDRLTVSNESLSQSNKNLTDILNSKDQPLRESSHSVIATLTLPTERSPLDRPDRSPVVSVLALPDLPRTGSLGSRQSLPVDATYDQLQRCMGSVQELAKTIARAMSAWQGHEKSGNSDIHGSHAKVVAELTKLPAELECEECAGHVSWSQFDLAKGATESLGTCICVGRTLAAHWRPSVSIASHLGRSPSASPLPPGTSSDITMSPNTNIDKSSGFDFNQAISDQNSSLDPVPLNPNGPDILQPQLDSSLDPMATTTMQSHNPTPPHLFPEMSHRQSISPSPHASPHIQQASFQNVSNMSRPRGTSGSLNPSSAAYPQGNGTEWLGMGGYRAHQRSPSDQLSDISSAHNSPYMQTMDSFDHSSPMLNPSADPAFSDGLGLRHFSLNDPQNAAQNFYSPGHSPAISPRLMPQQNELPAFTADNNFGMVPAMSGQFGQPNDRPEMFPSYGHDAFPAYGHNQPTSPSDLSATDQMSPPETNIDYAPPAKDNQVNRPSRSIADGEILSPPIRHQSRNRMRAKSDSHAGSRPMIPSQAGRGRSPSLQPPTSSGSLAPYDDTSTSSRSSSPARGCNGSLLSRNGRSSSNASDQRDYILDLANPERTPSNGAESCRQQKHPATFQCTLCPKRFTRAYNLRSHLRTHTDERPFVCTVCSKAFARQHDRKRHEGLHSGEKKFVCRGTLQSSASWGCGRRFGRADALGRHFRSDAGRVCIKPLLDEEAAERQKAWLEEQQQAQVAAGLVVPQPLLAQPLMDMMNNFLPAAILQQYPALAGLDWNALPQGPPPDEEAYSGRSSFHVPSDGAALEALGENEHMMSPTQNLNIGGSATMDHRLDTQQQAQVFGGDQTVDYVNRQDGSGSVNAMFEGHAIEGKSAVQALLTRWLSYEAVSTLLVGSEAVSSR